MSHRVELRVLTTSPDPLGMEVHPLALVHWDGRELRLATKAVFPAALENRRAPLRRLIQTIAKRAQSIAEPHLDLGLDHLFPVREGDAGVTSWSPIRVGQTSDPQAHFEELALALRLVRTQRTQSISAVELRAALVDEARLLVARAASTAHAGEVVAGHRVEGYRDFESPLSWRRDHWWHTYAVVPTLTSQDEGIGRVLNTFKLRMPAGDGLLVVVSSVDEPAAAAEFEQAIRYLGARGDDRLQSLRIAVRDDVPDMAPVRSRVLDDIGLPEAA